jgi:spermidine synthase
MTAPVETTDRIVATERSFFGALMVVDNGPWRSLMHGSTNHGTERRATPRALPSTYYAPLSPMSWAVTHSPVDAHIGVVGLGTGSLARLLQPGQRLTYYEIDPIVEPIARRWFSFLGNSQGDVRVVLGDARLTLAASDAKHPLLIVDAFSSDAVPVHLLTAEAFTVYLSHLSDEGLLLVHISNRYVDLLPVLRGHAARLGLSGAIRRYRPGEEELEEGATPSTVVALARSARAIEPLGEAHWDLLDPQRSRVDWTDDRSTLLPLLKPLGR